VQRAHHGHAPLKKCGDLTVAISGPCKRRASDACAVRCTAGWAEITIQWRPGVVMIDRRAGVNASPETEHGLVERCRVSLGES